MDIALALIITACGLIGSITALHGMFSFSSDRKTFCFMLYSCLGFLLTTYVGGAMMQNISNGF